MTQLLQTIILGLLLGGVYALLASGLTLIFGVMDVINVAQGALIILASFICWALWNETGIDPLLGVLVATPAMFVVGYLIYVTTIRWIQGKPASTSVILTFGIALVIEGVMGYVWTATLHRTTPDYFNQSFTIGDIYLRKAQVYGCAIAIGVLAILYVILRVTWLGRAIRAVSANMSSARLVGVNPSTVAALTFAIGVATTGAGGAIASVLYPFLPALALPVDLAAARHHRPRRDGQPSGRGRRRASARRGRDDDPDLPLAPVGHHGPVGRDLGRPARAPAGPHGPQAQGGRRAVTAAAGFLGRNAGRLAIVALFVTILIFPVISGNRYYQTIIILSLLLAIMASSWNIISGFAGYVSLGQTVFLGIGAYTTAILSLRVFGPDEFGQGGANPFYFIPISAIVAGLFAAAVGPIIMRTRGHSFVILTIAFLFVMQLVVLNWTELTYGNRGLSLPLPDWPREWGKLPIYYIFLGLLLLTIATAWWIRRTKFGMGLIAIREDEDKAASVGVNTPIYKVLAYIASAVWIGAAGGVYGYYLSFIDPRNMFDIVYSVFVVLAALLGGRGTIWGPVLGAFILEPVNQITNNDFPRWFGSGVWGANQRLIFFGALLALVVLCPAAGDHPERPGHPRETAREEDGRRGRRALRAQAARRRRTARGGGPGDACRAAARDPGSREALRRRQGRGRRLARGRARLDHRADRPERVRQDDALQPHRRDDVARHGRDLVRRRAHRQARAVPPRSSRASAARSRSRACSSR